MMIKGLLIWKERFRMLMFVKKIIFKGGSEMKFLCGYFPMIVFAMLSFVSFSAIGQDVVTPTVPELGPSVMELWKAIADKAPLAVVLVAVMQMLRTDLFGNLLGKINTGLLPLVTIVIGLVIATRPDCVNEKLLDYLQELAEEYYIVLEYGIETCNDFISILQS